MKRTLFCLLLPLMICGCCHNKRPQDAVNLAVKSLDDLQTLSAVVVSNAAYDGAEFSDKMKSEIPFLYKKVVKDSVAYAFTFEDTGDRYWYRDDKYVTGLYPDILIAYREPVGKRSDYLYKMREELVVIQEILDGKRPKTVSPDSSRVAEEWVEMIPDTLVNGKLCYLLKRHDDVTLIPAKSKNKQWKANVDYKLFHSYNTYTLAIDRETGIPVDWSYTYVYNKDGRTYLDNRNKEFLKDMVLNQDIPDSRFYPPHPEKIHYLSSFDELMQEVEAGDEAPAYQLTDVRTGKVYNNEGLKGKTVVLHFTSSGCPGCVLSQPGLNKLYEGWKDFPDVVFICVALMKEKDAKNMAEALKIAYPMTVCSQKFFWTYGVQYIPSYVVIGKNNKVIARPKEWMELRRFLQKYQKSEID